MLLAATTHINQWLSVTGTPPFKGSRQEAPSLSTPKSMSLVCEATVVEACDVLSLRPPLLALQEASGVLAEVAELTSQNQALNKTFMALAGVRVCTGVFMCAPRGLLLPPGCPVFS